MAKLTQTVSDTIRTAKTYWKQPAKGNFVSYKEIICLGLGGFGAQWLTLLATSIGLSANNYILGACFQMDGMHLQTMLVIANLVGIPLGILRNYIYDNSHMKDGKFLPFIKHTAIPTVITAIIFVWLPVEQMTYMQKAVAIEILYLLMTVFLCFYNESYQFFQQIISPNTQERVNVMSITQIIFSLAPSISNALIPTIAPLLFTQGLADIRTYRYIYPVFTIIGLVFNFFFRGTKERIVLPKEKQERIRMIDAIREISKNKYFWIMNLAGWFGFLEGAAGVVLSWTFVYGNNGENSVYLGLINTLIGNGALFSMILAPFLIRIFGKRNLLITSNLLNVVLLTILYFVYKNPVLVVIVSYINNFVSVFYNIYYPGINADMRDYHQYKTGVRIDGLFGVVGILGTFIGFGTGYVVPYIYNRMGLYTDYSVLYDDTLRNNLLGVLIIASAIGAVINVFPYLFYDLTESKHRGYVKVLRIRAMLADYVNNDLSDEDLINVTEIILRAKECYGKEKIAISKDALKAAKRLPKGTDEEKETRLAAIKAEKAEIKRIQELNDDIENAPIVIEELEKYSTERFVIRKERAKETVSDGMGYCYENIRELKNQARLLPTDTQENKQIRADILTDLRIKAEASKIIKKYFADGIYPPDESQTEALENTTGKSFIQVLADKRKISQIVKQKSLYNRAIKPYTDAVKLIETARNYTYLDEIEAKYQSLKNQITE